MRIHNPIVNEALGLGVSFAIHSLMRTIDYRAAYADRRIDPVFGEGGPRVYVFWHESILAPLFLRAHCHISMLLSRHRDADVLEVIARRSGYGVVRGSSFRGGATALLELVERSRAEHLTMTPDGPRGPRRRMAVGPVYLASKLGMPLTVNGA